MQTQARETVTKRETKASRAAAEKEAARERLRELLPPGSTVWTSVKHVSRSGMYRAINCYVMVDNQPVWISRTVATATGMRFDEKHEAVGAGGCGMDMGFHVVHELAYALYGREWPCVGEGCPSNVHVNGDRDRTVGRMHGDGGYALRQRWM